MVLKKKFGVRSASNVLSYAQMKNVVAGYGDGYDGGGYNGSNVCWHYCYTYDGERTASYWGTCYDAYHECNRRGSETASCGCNG